MERSSVTRSTVELVGGMLHRLPVILSGLLLDPFDLADRLFGVNVPVPRTASWALFGAGLFAAAALTYHNLKQKAAALEARCATAPDAAKVAAELSGIKAQGNWETLNLGWLMAELEADLSRGFDSRKPPLILVDNRLIGTFWQDVAAKYVARHVIERTYFSGPDPAPAGGQLPYYHYELNDFGIEVLAELKRNPPPGPTSVFRDISDEAGPQSEAGSQPPAPLS